MNIIIEGCDGVGKTTLVTKLKEYYNVDSIRLSYKDPKDYNFYSRILEKTDCIFDRHFLSEIVYSIIFERECELNNEELNKLYKQTIFSNIPILILDTDTSEILRRLDERGNEHQTIVDNIDRIRKYFKKLSEACNIEIIDTSKISFEDIIRKVENYNEKHRNSEFK